MATQNNTAGALTPQQQVIVRGTPASSPPTTQQASDAQVEPTPTTDPYQGNDLWDQSHDLSGNWQPSSGGLLNKFTHGLAGKVEGALVNAGGRTTQDTVDASGQIHQMATAAQPGQLFKNLLIGSLMGLGAATRNPRGGFLGAVGSGFTAGVQQQQQQSQEARNQAIQNEQLKQQAQEYQDKHDVATQEQARTAASITNLNANTYAIGLQSKKLNQDLQDEFYKNNNDYVGRQIASGGTYAGRNKTWSEVQQFRDANQGSTHKYTARAIGQEEVKDVNGNTVLRGDGKPEMEDIYDIVQLPDDHTLTDADVKAFKPYGILDDKKYKVGQVIPGDVWYGLDNQLQIKQHQSLQNKQIQADINARQAQADAAMTEASKYALDIKDTKQADQAKQDYGDALQEAGNDTTKAQQIMQQKYPNSYRLLAASEEMSLANSPTVDQLRPDGMKVSVARPRLFTSTTVSPQQQAILDQAKKDGKKVAVSGPKGAFLIDPAQFATYLNNGYNLIPQGQSTPNTNSEHDSRSQFQKQFPKLSRDVGMGADAALSTLTP